MGGVDGVTKGPVRDHILSRPPVWRSSHIPCQNSSEQQRTYSASARYFFLCVPSLSEGKSPTIPPYRWGMETWSRIRSSPRILAIA